MCYVLHLLVARELKQPIICVCKDNWSVKSLVPNTKGISVVVVITIKSEVEKDALLAWVLRLGNKGRTNRHAHIQ